MSQYAIENLLREPTEIYSAITLASLALLAMFVPHLFLFTHVISIVVASGLLTLAFIRAFQAYRIKRYQHRLNIMPYYALSLKNIPSSKERLFLGRGFHWKPLHTQRLHQIKQIHHAHFVKAIKDDRGGHAYLHGVGNKDQAIFIPQSVRVGHTFVVGTTRVGKTRLASVLIHQDIQGGDAVIVVDPKGDFALIRDMYTSCALAGRLQDFKIMHLGFPEISVQYNPLKQFDQISEVATRITDAIPAEGEGKQFAAFAWKYVNIVAMCLEEMNQPITYQSIAFYITRLPLLLVTYADNIIAAADPTYMDNIKQLIEGAQKIDKHGKISPPMERTQAIIAYLKTYIEPAMSHSVLIDLYDAAILDKQYYDKITASVGPVLSEINKSNAAKLFSFQHSTHEIKLMDVIKQKKIIYIGLDSLTNPNVAQAVGKAFLSDLVSTAGKLYKESGATYTLNLHCDELSEIIQDSFVKILNKAGGAGFQVTAYAQTKQDLEVALGSNARAEVTAGNLNTLIMLRVKNEETAQMLVNVLPKVDVVSHTQVSMVNDTPHGEDGVYFNTTNEDRVQTVAQPMIDVSDVIALPKGQAFVLVNGGELYKIRIPLPRNDGCTQKNINELIRIVN